MCTRNDKRPLARMLTAGFVFLIPASVSNWYLHNHTGLGDGLTDGITGLLYGITITCFIIGLAAARRPPSATS